MQFGFTLKPEHTIERTLALTRQAEAAGFDYGWLFDSHVLWREPYVLLTLMAQATTTAAPRDLRHEPGHPRAERHRVHAGRPRRDLRRPDGPRHRPRRLGPARPRQAADDDGHARGGGRRHQGPRRGPVRRLRGHGPQPAVDRLVDAAGLGRRLRSDGPGDDRPGRRRGHPPARRPGPHPLVRRPGPRGGRGGRPRPGLDQGPGRGAGPRRPARATAASGRAGSRRSSATTSSTSSTSTRASSCPRA